MTSDDNLLRPDMTIQLPNGREIVVDAKTPLDAFLDATGNSDPAAQGLRFAAHAQRVKTHLSNFRVRPIGSSSTRLRILWFASCPAKRYSVPRLRPTPRSSNLARRANVVMATPTTLIALLEGRRITDGSSRQVTQNAKAIQETGRRSINKFVNAHGYFSKMGSALERAVENYNKFVGAVEGSKEAVYFSARQLGNLVHLTRNSTKSSNWSCFPRFGSPDAARGIAGCVGGR